MGSDQTSPEIPHFSLQSVTSRQNTDMVAMPRLSSGTPLSAKFAPKHRFIKPKLSGGNAIWDPFDSIVSGSMMNDKEKQEIQKFVMKIQQRNAEKAKRYERSCHNAGKKYRNKQKSIRRTTNHGKRLHRKPRKHPFCAHELLFPEDFESYLTVSTEATTSPEKPLQPIKRNLFTKSDEKQVVNNKKPKKVEQSETHQSVSLKVKNDLGNGSTMEIEYIVPTIGTESSCVQGARAVNSLIDKLCPQTMQSHGVVIAENTSRTKTRESTGSQVAGDDADSHTYDSTYKNESVGSLKQRGCGTSINQSPSNLESWYPSDKRNNGDSPNYKSCSNESNYSGTNTGQNETNTVSDESNNSSGNDENGDENGSNNNNGSNQNDETDKNNDDSSGGSNGGRKRKERDYENNATHNLVSGALAGIQTVTIRKLHETNETVTNQLFNLYLTDLREKSKHESFSTSALSYYPMIINYIRGNFLRNIYLDKPYYYRKSIGWSLDDLWPPRSCLNEAIELPTHSESVLDTLKCITDSSEELRLRLGDIIKNFQTGVFNVKYLSSNPYAVVPGRATKTKEWLEKHIYGVNIKTKKMSYEEVKHEELAWCQQFEAAAATLLTERFYNEVLTPVWIIDETRKYREVFKGQTLSIQRLTEYSTMKAFYLSRDGTDEQFSGKRTGLDDPSPPNEQKEAKELENMIDASSEHAKNDQNLQHTQNSANDVFYCATQVIQAHHNEITNIHEKIGTRGDDEDRKEQKTKANNISDSTQNEPEEAVELSDLFADSSDKDDSDELILEEQDNNSIETDSMLENIPEMTAIRARNQQAPTNEEFTALSTYRRHQVICTHVFSFYKVTSEPDIFRNLEWTHQLESYLSYPVTFDFIEYVLSPCHDQKNRISREYTFTSASQRIQDELIQFFAQREANYITIVNHRTPHSKMISTELTDLNAIAKPTKLSLPHHLLRILNELKDADNLPRCFTQAI